MGTIEEQVPQVRTEDLPSARSEASPYRVFWRHFRRAQLAVAGAVVLVVFYFCILFAPFIAPYGMVTQDLDRFYHPPTAVHLRDAQGHWHAPFVYGTRLTDRLRITYEDDTTKRYPVKLFPRGEPYRLLWLIPTDIHLFGVEPPGKIFLFGADQFGRDVFSRLLFGGRISLSVGLFGILITYSLGLLFGGIAGYYRGLVDNLLMRLSEIMMSIPALYLILALRAAFPADMRSDLLYLIIILILSLVLWASLARIIRGMVLSLRENEYVTAAEALGMSSLRVIVRHILPNTASFVIVAATLSVPGYILGEVALSFLGAGIQEPVASWGNMLQQAQSIRVLTSFPWILTPGIFIFLTVLAFNFLGDGLRDALDPRRVEGKR
jgi:peptide/nickel transport system permease protein